MDFVFVAIGFNLPICRQKLKLQTGVCKSFYAPFHLRCYREPPKAGVADTGGLDGLNFSFCLDFNLTGLFDTSCSGCA